ncbi:hypothetical protein HK096_007049 [Nowakowskiella sp. JEL0078]|nr:hypothetical protein HK096_007049 [Nowakowskiella sp. JEL0078]
MSREFQLPELHDESVAKLSWPREYKQTIISKTLGQHVSDTTNFRTLYDLLIPKETPAIIAKADDTPQDDDSLELECCTLSFSAFSHFVASTPSRLGKFGISRGDRIGIIVLNNVNFALALTSVMSLCAAIPLNPSGTLDEIINELLFLRVNAAIVCIQKVTDTGGEILNSLKNANIEPIILYPKKNSCGLFSLRSPDNNESQQKFKSHPNSPEDVALILRTSGTSGNKKTVTYTLKTLVVGAICVAKSWDLKSNDVNLNMMPLYHVGGIVRNLLAPILSGSSVIITSGFDPVLFWDFLDLSNHTPTWYYAVPTMHNAILDEGRKRYPSGYPFKPNTLGKNKKISFYVGNTGSMSRSGGRPRKEGIRMICNAGAGMVPRLANDMKEFFGACILPSYGMTECMPITTPPIGYSLERPGTSGISVGPEIAILGDDDRKKPPGEIGYICVRGVPCFTGYEGDPEATEKSFTKDGWFNTGDMDITGRSKEVINRGGEIISPVEIEEVVITHPRVKACLAFVVPHEVFQETIGILIVSEPNIPKVDLVGIQKHIAASLHPSKWPQVIVYMPDLPTNQTNKVVRINLANRLGIAKISDGIPISERTYVAECPPKSSGVKDPINCRAIKPREEICFSVLKQCQYVTEVEIVVTKVGVDPNALVAYVGARDEKLTNEILTDYLSQRLDDYDIPSKIVICPGGKIPRQIDGSIDVQVLKPKSSGNGIQRVIKRVFQSVLSLPEDVELFGESDFFFVGGDSLTAGKAAALIRKKLGVEFQPHVMFKTRTVEAISAFIVEKLPKDHPVLKENFRHSRYLITGENRGSTMSVMSPYLNTSEKKPKVISAANSSASFQALFVQALPFAILKPTRRIMFFIFLCFTLSLKNNVTQADLNIPTTPFAMLLELLISIIIVSTVYVQIGLPLVGIFVKWLVIGRYKAGRFPLWGQYYLRWWFVDQTIRLCGVGFFNENNLTIKLYLRLMGAKIGSSVKIDSLKKSNFKEFDLIEIGDNSAFDCSRVRPFAMDGGNMILEKIKIGSRCVINVSTVIAPGANIPADTCFPPLSSSHEIQDARTKYQDYCRTILPGPNMILKIFIGYPLIGLVNVISMTPWLMSLYLLVSQSSNGKVNRFTSSFPEIVVYFSQIYRIAFKCFGLIVRDIVTPFIFIIMTIIVKRLILGLANPEKPVTQWDLLRRWVMGKLLGDGSLGGLNKLLGKHYEYTSMIYRALGAKVGTRIYWPGTGLYIGEHEYLTVGDDVVFGSRSHIITADASGPARVTIENGAMIADRCVLLPGVHVGRSAMLGTGSLGKRQMYYPAGSIYLGSKKGGAVLWDEGNEQSAKEMSTITPFGVSFYGKQANYSVIPMWMCPLYCILIATIAKILDFMPLLGSIQVGSYFFENINSSQKFPVVVGVLTMIGTYIVFAIVKSLLILTISISAKWVIHGRRKPGKYNWDESSYCQRWQILIAFQSLSSELLEVLRGSWYLVLYFRLLGSNIGKRVCLYPTGADPMMTEADLVTIGDNVMIDNASVICHINSKGQFSLNPLVIREGASMRAQSRLLSGAEMDEDAVLLEHTLILSGDVAAKGVWQGWPLGNPNQEGEEKNDSESDKDSIRSDKTYLNSVETPKREHENYNSNHRAQYKAPQPAANQNVVIRQLPRHASIHFEQFYIETDLIQTNLENNIQIPSRGISIDQGARVASRSNRHNQSNRVRNLRDEDYAQLRRRARESWTENNNRLADMNLRTRV